MEKNHITLAVEVPNNGATTVRKSLRRSWNQLPRCQRNLIIFGIFAACITFLFILPGDQITSDSKNSLPFSGVFPFHNANRKGGGAGGGGGGSGVGGDVAANRAPSSAVQNALEANERSAVAVPPPLAPVMPAPEAPPIFKEVKMLQPPPQGLYQGALAQKHNAHVPHVPHHVAPHGNDHVAAVEHNRVDIQEVNVKNDEEHGVYSADTGGGGGGGGGAGSLGGGDGGAVVQTGDVDAVRSALEAAVLAPDLLPANRGQGGGAAITEFIERLDAPGDAQRQHFHGATNERQEAVVAAFKHSWAGYKKFAWGHDNLKPISQGPHDWFELGLTIVDSLDTMYIMGLEEEFVEARDWVSEFLTFDVNRDINLFEVTIRVLGGLLSSYHLSGEKMFLKKSIELGNRLLPCFLSPSGIPYSDVNLAAMSAHSPKWSPDSSTSEVTTLQLEFRDLSRSTNTHLYEQVVEVVNERVHALDKNHGLVPIFINANTGSFRSYSTVSLGARGDSYYEYLLKQWLQTGRKRHDVLIVDYMSAIDGVMTQLMRRTPREQHLYVGELINGKDFKPKMDHLTCYLPGTLLLGHKCGMPESHLLLARELLETCYQTYMRQPTHLAPEISYFAINDNEEHEIYVKPNDAHNLLRPEFIESLYYFYVLTGNRTYQDMGWNIFQAFEKYTKVTNGYTSIGNVKNILNTRLRDMMESFWLSETLKYFYLLFSDNRKEIDLDKWVFNSEAHPLPIRNH